MFDNKDLEKQVDFILKGSFIGVLVGLVMYFLLFLLLAGAALGAIYHFMM